jgi:hypothetical protein
VAAHYPIDVLTSSPDPPVPRVSLELIGQQRHEDGEVVQEAGLRGCPASAPRARIRFSTPAGPVPSGTIRTRAGAGSAAATPATLPPTSTRCWATRRRRRIWRAGVETSRHGCARLMLSLGSLRSSGKRTPAAVLSSSGSSKIRMQGAAAPVRSIKS